jgi:hypothetical protein
MCIAICAGVLGYLCAIFLPVVAGMGLLGIVLQGGGFTGSLFKLSLLMALMALMRGVLRYIEQACNHYIAFRLLALIRHKVFSALRELCPAKLEVRDKGDLIALITGDIELLEVFYAHTISPIAIAFITSLLLLVFIGRYHLLYALIAFLGYCLVGIVIPLVNSKKGALEGMQYRQQFAQLNSYILESLRGLKETLQYGADDRRLKELKNRCDELAKSRERLKRLEGASAGYTGICISTFSFATLFASVLIGSSFEEALLVSLAVFSSFGPLTALSALSNNLMQTLASGERVLALLDEEPVVREVEGREDIDFEGVDLDAVSFAYEKEKIIDNLSLSLAPKKIIGILGRSGSGKSTLLRLIMRFWDTDRGRILISGRDVKEINTKNLRAMESFLTQDTVIFHDTIAENIAIADASAGREQIIEAAKKASVHDFIMSLPKGYDTKASELGSSLSGGERQRIGLARAFLHNASLMLLDEPTSNLDSLNEGIILRALEKESEQRSIVLVSHRKSTLNIADEVIKLEPQRSS